MVADLYPKYWPCEYWMRAHQWIRNATQKQIAKGKKKYEEVEIEMGEKSATESLKYSMRKVATILNLKSELFISKQLNKWNAMCTIF